jgi:hypothetical protein
VYVSGSLAYVAEVFAATFSYEPGTLARSGIYPETKSFSARLAVHHELSTRLKQRLGRVPHTWLLNHAHSLVELSRTQRRAGGAGVRHRGGPASAVAVLAVEPIRLPASVPAGLGGPIFAGPASTSIRSTNCAIARVIFARIKRFTV